MYTLVTGGTGFLGKQIVKGLLKRGKKVRILTREKSRSALANSQLIDYANGVDLTSNCRPDYHQIFDSVDTLIHAAWCTSPADYSNHELNRHFLAVSVELINQGISRGIKKVVGIGTCLEYGRSPVPISVSQSLRPENAYGQAKAELFFFSNERLKRNHINFAWCRPFFLYGSDERQDRLFPYILNCIRSNIPIELSNPQAIRDYLSVETAGEIISEISQTTECGAFNICSGRGMTVRDIAMIIARRFSKVHLLPTDPLKKNESMDKIVGIPNYRPGLYPRESDRLLL